MLLPEVIGFKFTGKLKEGVTATDLVLTVTQMLRKRGVVGKFVEFFGPGLDNLSLADRATIGNMAPEYGATCGFFPIDDETINYLKDTGRSAERIALVAAYAKAQGMFRTKTTPDPMFTDVLKLDLANVEPSLAGPKRPQDRVPLKEVKVGFTMRWTRSSTRAPTAAARTCSSSSVDRPAPLDKNRKAAARAGRRPQARSRPWRRGDRGDHLVHQHVESERHGRRRPAGAQGGGQGPHREAVGEDLAGAGLAGGRRISRQVRACRRISTSSASTWSASAAPPASAIPARLPPEISKAINDNDLVAAAVLSGNRNFEGRVNADVRANYLASPPLVVAYALAGSMNVRSRQGAARHRQERQAGLPQGHLAVEPRDRRVHRARPSTSRCSRRKYADVFKGDANWRKISVKGGTTYNWDRKSTYVQNPPYFTGMGRHPTPLDRHRRCARAGAVPRLDHHRPHLAGGLDQGRFAGRQIPHRAQGQADRLQPVRHAARQSRSDDARHLRQHPHQEPDGAGRRRRRDRALSVAQRMPIYDAAMRYKTEKVPLVVFAGKEYGTGSSRDWAAKGGEPARHARGGRAVVRAHPSLEPGRHGRAAARASRKARPGRRSA